MHANYENHDMIKGNSQKEQASSGKETEKLGKFTGFWCADFIGFFHLRSTCL
jgi:hypothetical protein